MALLRRIRHRTSRRQLAREAFYVYVVAFVFMFLELHFVGIKRYTPSFHREYLSVNTAALRAIAWAFLGPVVWVMREYLFQDTELWRSFSSLDQDAQRLVLAGLFAVIFATVIAWRWMLPLWGLATAVAFYLRFSRPKDSL